MAAVAAGWPRALTDAEFLSLHVEPLASGSSATVGAGVFEGRRVVVKRFLPLLPGVQNATRSAADKLHRCRHANVVELIAFSGATAENCVLVLERLEHVRYIGRTRSEILLALAGAAQGLAHMHEVGVVHGEIDASSLFIRTGLEQCSIAAGVIGGLSGGLSGAPAVVGAELSFRDPQLAAGAPPTFESDVYAFGVAALTLLCRQSALTHATVANEVQALLAAGFTDVAPLLRSMVESVAASRPNMTIVAARFQALVARGGTAAPAPSWKEAAAELRDTREATAVARATQRVLENMLTFDASALAHTAAVAGFRAGLVSVVLGDHAENATVAQLARTCKASLTTLEIAGTSSLITDLSPLAACAVLAKLNVEGCKATEVSLARAVINAPNLSMLCVSNTSAGNALVRVVGNAPCAATLRELYCKGCAAITDATPLGNCAGLLKLVLNGTKTTDASLAAALPHWTELQLLSVSGCGSVGDASVTALAGMASAARTLRELFCRDIAATSKAFAALAACRAITTLNIAGMRFEDADIQTVVRGIAALEVLNLTQCALVGDGAIGAVVEHNKTLRQLWLNGCVRVTAEGIARLAQCAALDTLAVGSVPAVTDATLAPVLAVIAPKLVFLNISDTAVTKNVLAPLRDAKKLRELNCIGCNKITATDAVQMLSENLALRVQH